MAKGVRSESKSRNLTDSRGRTQVEQRIRNLAEQRNRSQTDTKAKTQIDLKRSDSKMSRPTELKELKRTRSTTDLMGGVGVPRNQSAALENLSKAKRVKDCLMEAIRWMNTSQPFDKTPFRCAVLRAHYNWTAGMLFLIFFYAVSTYYGEEPIRCIDHYDRSQASREVLDICVQFPYTMKNDRARTDHEKKYALFYMWAHWGCAVLLCLYKIVHVCVYVMENKALKRFLETLQKNIDYNYRVHLVRQYFQENYGNHRHLTLKVMLLHVIAMVVNAGVFFSLNLFFDFKYMLLPRFLLVQRDFSHFDDEYSMMFPPFVECEITPKLHIQVGRTNYYGCHLPLMEFYEKIFMMLWFWQVFLFIWTFCSLLSWSTHLCMKKQRLDAQELFRHQDTKKLIDKLPIDEIVVLNLVKVFMFGQHYRAFLTVLVTWNPHVSELIIPLDQYRIKYPYVLRGLSALVDEDLEAVFEDMQQDIPISLREEAFAKGEVPTGWTVNLPAHSSLKPRPSAPAESPFSYETGPDNLKYGSEKYGWQSGKSTDNSDSGTRTPSTMPAACRSEETSGDEM